MTGPRLSIIPARAATDPALKPRDLQVLCVLGRHTDDLGWCSKSQVKMAKEMGCARSTVFEAVERLMQAGYLERYEQEGANGRDCPHLYRVILDPKHPDPSSIEIDDDGSEDPADQSAPPAGISAPPAGPGPAPKNDPTGTLERERAREEPEEDRGKVERAFERAFRAWPTSIGDSRPEALKVWLTLTPEERKAAESEAERYLAATRSIGRKHVASHAVYLREKRWLGLPKADAPKAAYVEASPFSRLWMAARLKQLLAGPAAPLPGLTRFERDLVERGVATEDQIRRDKQARSGFPAVTAMHDRAKYGQGVTASTALQHLEAMMEQVWPGSELLGEWEAEHLRRGWPWLPEFKQENPLFLPAGGPEEGLRAFEAAIKNGEGKTHDGGGRQAAE